MKQTKRILELAGLKVAEETTKLIFNEGEVIDAMKDLAAIAKLSATLVADGKALESKLKKVTDAEGAIAVLKGQVKAAKKKIKTAKMSNEAKKNFEEDFFNSYFESLAKAFSVPVDQIKELLGESALGTFGFADDNPINTTSTEPTIDIEESSFGGVEHFKKERIKLEKAIKAFDKHLKKGGYGFDRIELDELDEELDGIYNILDTIQDMVIG